MDSEVTTMEENKDLMSIRIEERGGLTIKDPAHMSVQIKAFNDNIYFVGFVPRGHDGIEPQHRYRQVAVKVVPRRDISGSVQVAERRHCGEAGLRLCVVLVQTVGRVHSRWKAGALQQECS